MMTFRSALFMAWFLLITLLMAIIFLPLLAVPRKATVWMARHWARATLWGLQIFSGIDQRQFGETPRGGVLVASKHMSMWDTLALYIALDDPGIVLKRELLRIPFYGWYLWKAAAIPIDRAAGASALRRMTHDAQTVLKAGRPILIFPEGTRKELDAAPDYKPGAAMLYTQLGMPCVPMAHNSGVFFGSFLKLPGIIVVEFLPTIPPGLPRREFAETLEKAVEIATSKLVAEGRATL